MRLAFALVPPLALALALAGCLGAASTRALPPVEAADVEAHLRRLVLPAPDSVAAARRARYVAAEMREAGLVPAAGSSFLVGLGVKGDPSRAHALGYVAGRHPRRARGLLLVAADLDTPGAAAALAAARRLEAEARLAPVPERTVLFALWGPPRTGGVGLHDYLRRPTWPPERIERVLLVMSDTAGAAERLAFLAARGLTAEVVTVEEATVAGPETTAASTRARAVARTARLAEALLARLRGA